MRIEQPAGTRGSLKWIQRLVDLNPGALDEPLFSAGALSARAHLKWLSPLRADHWAEYRDAQFLSIIRQRRLADELRAFWPRRGPQWDAVATDESGRIFLFEAKAHALEMSSTCKARNRSLRTIVRSLESAKVAFGAKQGSDWLHGYYQYANRLAHLHFLQRHGVHVHLIFLYFTNDDQMNGPCSQAEWRPHIEAVHAQLGIAKETLGVVTLFQDVRSL